MLRIIICCEEKRFAEKITCRMGRGHFFPDKTRSSTRTGSSAMPTHDSINTLLLQGIGTYLFTQPRKGGMCFEVQYPGHFPTIRALNLNGLPLIRHIITASLQHGRSLFMLRDDPPV